jgi:hypothetical protein
VASHFHPAPCANDARDAADLSSVLEFGWKLRRGAGAPGWMSMRVAAGAAKTRICDRLAERFQRF